MSDLGVCYCLLNKGPGSLTGVLAHKMMYWPLFLMDISIFALVALLFS